jgi:hypothetical protein
MPDSASLHVDLGDFDFVDDTLLPGLPLLEAIQQRFGLKEPKDVKHFLQGLAQRHIVAQ